MGRTTFIFKLSLCFLIFTTPLKSFRGCIKTNGRGDKVWSSQPRHPPAVVTISWHYHTDKNVFPQTDITPGKALHFCYSSSCDKRCLLDLTLPWWHRHTDRLTRWRHYNTTMLWQVDMSCVLLISRKCRWSGATLFFLSMRFVLHPHTEMFAYVVTIMCLSKTAKSPLNVSRKPDSQRPTYRISMR